MCDVSKKASPDGDKYLAYSDVVVCPARNGGSLRNMGWVPEWIERCLTTVNVGDGRETLTWRRKWCRTAVSIGPI